MTKYDKELDSRTDEYEEAIEPLERETSTLEKEREEDERDEGGD
jgi:hypothetical protein